MPALLEWRTRTPARGLAFEPRGRLLVSGHDEGFSFWWTASGELVRSITASPLHRVLPNDRSRPDEASPSGAIHCRFGFSRGNLLASLRDGHIGIWDVETGARTGTLTKGVLLDVSRDGRRALVIPSLDSATRPAVWDLDTGEPLAVLGADDESVGVLDAALSADGRVALLARGVPNAGGLEAGGRLEAWDLESGLPIDRPQLDAGWCQDQSGPVEISPLGTSAMAFTSRACALMWFPLDESTPDEDCHLTQGGTSLIAFLDDERIAWVQDRSRGSVQLWACRREYEKISPGSPRRPYHNLQGLPQGTKYRERDILAIAAAPDGRTVAIADTERALSLWDASQDPLSQPSVEFMSSTGGRPTRSFGPGDVCPCGSGRTYTNCHGA